jgi:hypothetical protein
MKWCVIYADGKELSSEEFEPREIPGLGVLIIVVKNDDGENAYLQHSFDYYVWKGDRWQNCDLFYLWQYWFVEKFDYEKASLAGYTVPNEDFLVAHGRAKEIRDKWNDRLNV